MKELFNQKLALGRYKLIIDENTAEFYGKIIAQTNELIRRQGYEIVKAVARAVYDQAGDGGYMWRSMFGGTFTIQEVIQKGPNCLDYSILVKEILVREFGIEGEIKKTKLVLVNDHQYFLTQTGEVLDLIVGIPEFPEGYFKTEDVYHNELNKINAQGFKIVLKQIKAIISPKTRKKL